MTDPASRGSARSPLERALDYDFRESALADLALQHPSYAHEMDGSRGNERLEFLGDAALDLAVAHLLFERHPDWSEGELTRARAALVNQRSLAEHARALGLPELVRLGRTEQRTGGADKSSILANCLEAVLGAVYLDSGLPSVVDLVRRSFGAALEGEMAVRDAKTAFQEWAHARFGETPGYLTVRDSGIDNDEERFTVEVRIGDEAWGTGIGRSKRAAERAAAQAALERETDRR